MEVLKSDGKEKKRQKRCMDCIQDGMSKKGVGGDDDWHEKVEKKTCANKKEKAWK